MNLLIQKIRVIGLKSPIYSIKKVDCNLNELNHLGYFKTKDLAEKFIKSLQLKSYKILDYTNLQIDK
jgi:hypothetical protein